MSGAIRNYTIQRELKLFFTCEDGAGQFHHGKATNRFGSTLISLSRISLAGLLTFLWVMHRNVGYSNNIFLCHGGKECVRIYPPSFIHEKPIIFCRLPSNAVFLLFQGICRRITSTF